MAQSDSGRLPFSGPNLSVPSCLYSPVNVPGCGLMTPTPGLGVYGSHNMRAQGIPLPATESNLGAIRHHPSAPMSGTALTASQARLGGIMSAPASLPSAAGPTAGQFNKLAGHLADFMMQNLLHLLHDLSQQNNSEATVKRLQLELEGTRWLHSQEIVKLKEDSQMRLDLQEAEFNRKKMKAVADCKRRATLDKERAISETKKRQWCANCGRGSIYPCCWNTSYCSPSCQHAHWITHNFNCAKITARRAEVQLMTAPATLHSDEDEESILDDENPSQESFAMVDTDTVTSSGKLSPKLEVTATSEEGPN